MANNNEHPFGGFFGVVGGLAGAGFALAIGGDMTAGPVAIMAFIFGGIGAMVGLFVEHVVARILIIAVFIIGFLARQAIFDTIREVFFG